MKPSRILHWWNRDCILWSMDAVACAGATSELFFFFFFFFINFILWFRVDLVRFVPTRLLFSLICAEPGLFGQNQAISAESGRIGWLLKQAEIGFESCQHNWNRLWMRPKHPKSIFPQFYFEYLLLHLCFLFCFVFLAVFFLVLWTKAILMCFLRIF